jgi:hypothetical protein
MKRLSLLAALPILAGWSGLLAQQPPAGNATNAAANPNRGRNQPQFAVWRAELPGGSFVVARSSINAISSQQYIVDGAARVTEVNISVSGAFQPRFYYIEPLAASAVRAVPGVQALADSVQTTTQNAVNRVVPGDPVWSKVVKNYPTTTHAGTIEFRLETQEQLDKLFESVERTWLTGKPEVYTAAGSKPYRSGKKTKATDENSAEPDAAADGAGDAGTPN